MSTLGIQHFEEPREGYFRDNNTMAAELVAHESPEAQVFPNQVELDVIADPTTGYAAIQNNIPILRSIVIKNKLSEVLLGVEIQVGFTPAFALGARFQFDRLEAGEVRKVALIDLQPDHGYMVKLDEAEKASITVKAQCAGITIAEISQTIEVLAYDQWAGTRSLPELLAAFCMPNSMVVDRLIGKAATLLRKTTHHCLSMVTNPRIANAFGSRFRRFTALC